jgi:hypothetical protein
MFHQTKVEGKTTTHVLCLIPPPENHAVYEITWNNVVEPGRPHMTIWRMRIACWISKAIKQTFGMCNTLLFHGVNGCMNSPQFIVCLVENMIRNR